MAAFFGRPKHDGEQPRRPGILVTSPMGLDVRAPLDPAAAELAPGLACGANMSVANGRAWNLLVDPDVPVENSRNLLQNVWGIHDPDRWRQVNERLFAGVYEDTAPEAALGVRVGVWRRLGRPPQPEEWLAALADPGQMQAAKRILAYEDAFRRDGLTPPLGVVHSLSAYDFGRAVHVALWALATGLVDEGSARAVIVFAGRRAAARYQSWEDYSAGFSLGRVLFYDDDQFGPMYDSTVRAYHVLASAPESPWRWLAWPAAPTA